MYHTPPKRGWITFTDDGNIILTSESSLKDALDESEYLTFVEVDFQVNLVPVEPGMKEKIESILQ